MAPVLACLKKGCFLWQSSRPSFALFVGKLRATVCEQLLSLAEALFILKITTHSFLWKACCLCYLSEACQNNFKTR